MAQCGDEGPTSPQHDDDDNEAPNDDFGMDLLARARLLCQAANEIALPMIQSVQQLKQRLDGKESRNGSRPKTREAKKNKAEEDEEKRREHRPLKAKTHVAKAKPPTTKESRGYGVCSSTLPSLAPTKLPGMKKQPPLPVKEMKKEKEKDKKKKKKAFEEEEEAAMPLPLINATDEWRKQREVETIRQAQERAKARLLKSKQVDHAPGKSNQQSDAHPVDPEAEEDRLRTIEANRRRANERVKQRNQERALQALEADEQEQAKLSKKMAEQQDDERLKQLEASRRRAEERIRQRKVDVAAEQLLHAQAEPSVAHHHQHPPSQSDKDTGKKGVDSFRHRTLQRLQTAKFAAQAQAQEERPETTGSDGASGTGQGGEDDHEIEEAEQRRKKQEKRRRRETAERLKRQQQIAEEQQRNEKELFEKGLNDFKTMRKELDRVAKGLQPAKKATEEEKHVPIVFSPQRVVSSPGSHSATTEEDNKQELKVADTNCSDTTENQGRTGGRDHPEDQFVDGLSIAVEDHTDHALPDLANEKPLPSSPSDTKAIRRKKLPPWKQPPVPILPAESYSQKALVSPQDSYAERFRSGRASPGGVQASGPFIPSSSSNNS